MKSGQWLRAATLAASVAAAVPRAGAAPSLPEPPTSRESAATQPAVAPLPTNLSPEQNLRLYINRLEAGVAQGSQPQRDEAAQRLLAIGSFETRSTVAKQLLGTDEKAQIACARAIADGSLTDPRWVQPLVQMLSRDRTAEPAARALVRYEGDARAYDLLIQAARFRQQPARLTIIRLLGQVVEKPVGETLIGLISDLTEEASTRTAAADALQDLSGQTANGADVRKWATWWDARKSKSPPDWRAQVIGEQHAALQRSADRSREQLRQFKASVRQLLANEYDRTPVSDKPKTLLAFLNDPDANVREIGASLVPAAIGSGQPITEDIHARLIDLVGDAAPEVRQEAVAALTTLADPNALPAILNQLQIEKSNTVKVALLRAVGRLGNARAIPILRPMLDDPSWQVASEAATALKALAPSIQNNQSEAQQLFRDLQQVLEARTGPAGQPNLQPGSEDLRPALIGAMGKLAASDALTAMDVFPRLLSQNESPRARQAALQGLATLGDKSGDVIAQELEPDVEPDPTVRRAAAIALGEVGSFSYANRLDASSGAREPDKQVRDAAWKSFQTLLPATTPRELSQWADLLHRRKEPEREVIVRRELARKLSAAQDVQNLAVERQRIGELYLGDLNQPAEAVAYLRDALTYWEANQAQPQTAVNLVREMMLALLHSGQYRDAVKFGEQEIRRAPANQLEVGPELWHAAERLIDKGDPASYRDAALLIQDAMNMNPPLDGNYRDQLESLRQRLPATPTHPS